MKVFILEKEGFSQKVIDHIKDRFEIQENLNEKTEIIICRLKFQLNEKFLDKFLDLKYIVSPTTGTSHIDIDFCEKRNIQILSLKNIPEKINNIRSTSELNLFLIIALIRNLYLAESNYKNIGPKDRINYRGRELSCLTIGIIGGGRIGGHLIEYLKSFKSKILIYDIDKKIKSKYKNIFCSSLNELIKLSDVISINADLNQKSENLISKEQINLMKGKYLVNTARAEIINKKDIVEGLKNNLLKGFATDVFWDEQNLDNYDSELLHLKNLNKNIILTPHLGGCTIDAMNKTEELIVDLLEKVLKNS